MSLDSNDVRFGVYLHVCRESGTIRYIGSGTERRIFEKRGRSKEHEDIWETLDKRWHTFPMTKEESQVLEKELIEQYWDTGLLLNKVKHSSKVLEIKYEYFKQFYKVSDKFPSGLERVGGSKFRGHLNKCGGFDGQYYFVKLYDVKYLAHRIIYCLHNKCDVPTNLRVDHIDKNKLNNNPSNLRLATVSENNNNRYKEPSITGVVGVIKTKSGSYSVRWAEGPNQKQFRNISWENIAIQNNISKEEAQELAFSIACTYREVAEERFYIKE